MNIENLRKLETYLREEPRRFDMTHWIDTIEDFETGRTVEGEIILDQPPCGTVHCLAGAACIALGASYKYEGEWQEPPEGWGAKSTKLLDLDSDQFERLFFLKQLHCVSVWVGDRKHWPENFEKAYLAASTPSEKVEVAIQRIEHFINTNGAE